MAERFRAQWVESLGKQPKHEFDPDAVEYGCKIFRTAKEARTWAHKHDFFNEGRVYHEYSVPQQDEHNCWDEWEEHFVDVFYDDGSMEHCAITHGR